MVILIKYVHWNLTILNFIIELAFHSFSWMVFFYFANIWYHLFLLKLRIKKLNRLWMLWKACLNLWYPRKVKCHRNSLVCMQSHMIWINLSIAWICSTEQNPLLVALNILDPCRLSLEFTHKPYGAIISWLAVFTTSIA